ncbi:MAG: TonB-dependent receptor, partial [Bacteroidota bacterium]
MNRYKYLIILALFTYHLISAQSIPIKGIVKDSETGLPIKNVTVFIPEMQMHTSTDSKGNFNFKNIIGNEFTLSFIRVGYREYTQPVIFIDGINLNLEISMVRSDLILGEAVVTSMRSARSVKDVPLPIELIDEKTVDKSIKISTSDVIEKAPGVSLVSDGSWATGVNIRGLSKQNIVYLIDGNRIETSTNISAGLSLVDLYDVKNIEIVKGGLSSLYGTGATGGVINILTHKVTANESLIVHGSFGSSFTSVNNGKAASLNLNISDKIWHANFTGTLRNAEDTKIPDGTLTNSGFKDNSISFTAGVLPFENTELIFNYQKFTAKDVGIPGGSPFPPNAKATYKYAGRELYSGELKFQNLIHSLSNLKIKFYSQLIRREVEIIPNQNAVVEPEADHQTNGLLVQADWTLAKNHFLITGIDAWERSYIGERRKTIIPQNRVIIDKPVPNSKFRTLGFFANDELHLVKNRFKLNFGARYDFIRVTNDQTNNPVSIITNGNEITPPPNPDASYDASDVKNSSWSGNVGLLYSLFQDVSLTFNTAYNFRSP